MEIPIKIERKKHCRMCGRTLNYHNKFTLCFDCDERKINLPQESTEYVING
jgi:hypothetical protein